MDTVKSGVGKVVLTGQGAPLVMPLTRDEIERYLRAALKQEGLTIVPKEPTKEMIDAACEDYADFTKHGPRIGRLWGSEAASIWRAMLSAAGKSETR